MTQNNEKVTGWETFYQIFFYSGLWCILFGGINYIRVNDPIEPIVLILGGTINVLFSVLIFSLVKYKKRSVIKEGKNDK